MGAARGRRPRLGQALTRRQVDLKDYIDARIGAIERELARTAVSVDERFHAANEVRGTLLDQAARFMPRTEVDAADSALTAHIDQGLAGLDTQVSALTDRVNLAAGRGAGVSDFRLLLISLIGAGASLVAILGALHHL